MTQESNALIIGCGNIGALYDRNNDEVLTHAKALFLTRKFNLFFYDNNYSLSKEIAEKYNGVCIEEITEDILSSADWISLCSPTDTHYLYLNKVLNLKKKFVLCEKPISNSMDEINNLFQAYKNTSSIIFVNYIRRFQPAYINLKNNYSNLFILNNLKECTIDYCRGFINNASHAFDLLEFLFDNPIDIQNVKLVYKEYDTFKNDPTVSLTAEWKNSKINVIGHIKTSRPIFKIKLLFDASLVEFLNSGNDIFIYDINDMSTPVFHQEDCLKNYMQNVISYFSNLKALNENSNFASSLNLNKKLLNYIGR